MGLLANRGRFSSHYRRPPVGLTSCGCYAEHKNGEYVWHPCPEDSKLHFRGFKCGCVIMESKISFEWLPKARKRWHRCSVHTDWDTPLHTFGCGCAAIGPGPIGTNQWVTCVAHPTFHMVASSCGCYGIGERGTLRSMYCDQCSKKSSPPLPGFPLQDNMPRTSSISAPTPTRPDNSSTLAQTDTPNTSDSEISVPSAPNPQTLAAGAPDARTPFSGPKAALQSLGHCLHLASWYAHPPGSQLAKPNPVRSAAPIPVISIMPPTPEDSLDGEETGEAAKKGFQVVVRKMSDLSLRLRRVPSFP